ncbi:hypothetical protein DXG01_006210 [Tephrocybe rancida]|nr:hypothetical protein DXG01_006210 [Tephrocybe rancida]
MYHVSSSENVDKHGERRRRDPALLFIMLLVWTSVSLVLGAFAYRGLYASDVADRKKQADHWKVQTHYWKEKSHGFEDEWKEKDEQKKLDLERAGLHWGNFTGESHCASSGSLRKYRAPLMNLTKHFSAREACFATPATINNITFTSPKDCDDQEVNDVVCSTYWAGPIKPTKECVARGSGLRRYEAKFGRFHDGEDYEILCMTTPSKIEGGFFRGPKGCEDRAIWGHEYWGVWDVPDVGCD